MTTQQAHATAERDAKNSGDLDDFKQFMQQREKVGAAYVRGDAAPLSEIVTHKSPATFFGPQGGYQSGAETVSWKYTKDAESFAPGGDSHFEILDIGASNGIGYWVGFQKATAFMKGRSEPMLFNLRVTEVFRRETDGWKLIHRHADPLAEAAQPKG
ncbi:MAG: nuclear transport factor 2 family protein [Chloroflexota bacterium]